MYMNTQIKFLNNTFKNPLIAASGTFGFGREYVDLYPISTFGGISLKGMTKEPRDGNAGVRVAETPAGLLNCVGLQNPGVEEFIVKHSPLIAGEDTVVIANIAGNTIDDYAYMAERLDGNPVIDILEVNISCPNVKHGGAAFGTDPVSAAAVTTAVKGNTKKPVMVKLSPNVTDITEIAKACEAAGADGLSLINTLLGMRIDTATRRPVLGNNVGGLSGAAVFPVAVRMVWQVARAVSIPICGLGGISSGRDVIEMMMAGASVVQIGSVMFNDPMTPVRIAAEVEQWLCENGVEDINEIVGCVEIN